MISEEFEPGGEESTGGVPDMAALIAGFDWAGTALGPLIQWPPGLRIIVNTLLAYPLPAIVLWGAELIQIYNDGYAGISTGSLPDGLGTPAGQCGWSQNWFPGIPGLDRAARLGEPLTLEDRFLPVVRRGLPRDAWFTLTCSQIRDENDRLAGAILTVLETTDRVLTLRERETAHRRLQESENLFRALVETSSEVVYRMNADWTEMQFLVGRDFIADTREPSRTWLETYIHREDQAEVTAAIGAAIHGKTVFELEHRVLRVDGTSGWTDSRAIPILDGNGEILEWFGMAADITPRREAQERLRESEANFRSYFEMDVVGTAQLGTDGRYLRVNNRLCEMVGYSREELLGMSPVDLDHPDEREADQQRIVDFFAGRVVPYHREKRYVRKDGGVIWVQVTAEAILDPEGRLDHTSAVVQDITARKQIEAAMAERKLLILSFDAILARDAGDRITYWSFGAEELYGYPAGQALGRRMHELMRTEFPEPFAAILDTLRREGRWAGELQQTRKDGSRIRVSSRWACDRDPQDGPPAILETNTDITASKKAEDDLARSLEELRTAQADLIKQERLATLGQLAGSVAHEMRTPLAVIRNTTYFLEHCFPCDDRNVREALAETNRAIASTDHIIAEMLDYVREPAQTQSRFPVSEPISRAVGLISLPESVHLLVRIEDEAGPLETRANEDQVCRCLCNLILNAIQAMPRGGKLEIRACAPGPGRISVSVSDTGCGIPPENQGRIFEPLFSTKVRGIGLGLAIAKRYAELNGGALTVESAPERGTVFTLNLPSNSCA
jgi:PAS domain S-box-containing protein